MHEKTTKGFIELFQGLDRAYGTYSYSEAQIPGEKRVGQAQTFNGEVTSAMYVDHLLGKNGLGIVPIDDSNHCVFGAIDIDVYDDLNHVSLYQDVGVNYFVCTTKSGGAHLYFFFAEPISAKVLQSNLKIIAARLGHGGAEVFPKQTELLADRGDVGSWINLPYFDAENTERFAISQRGDKLGLREFVEAALTSRNSATVFDKTAQLKIPTTLEQGPPCLNFLCHGGFPKGTRNDGLFNLGVYARKAFPTEWEKVVEEYNRAHLQPPLDSSEVLAVIKSLKRKDYAYTCHRPPIQSHCNAPLCRQQRYGVGGESGLPNIGGLTKLCTTPPVWFLDVEGFRMELSTDDLQSQQRFQRRCMETINRMPASINRAQWIQVVQDLLDNIHEIEVPKEASDEGQFLEFLRKFCTGRAQAKTRADVVKGKPFTEDKHYFRMVDLMAFLERNRFKVFRTNKVTAVLKNMGAEHHFWNISGRGINVWAIPLYDDENEDTD